MVWDRLAWRVTCPNQECSTVATRSSFGPTTKLISSALMLQWYGYVSCSSGLAKRWEDNIGEWTGLKFAKSQRAVKNREKMEETGCEIICGAPTTLAVKGLLLLMMIMIVVSTKSLSAEKGGGGADGGRLQTVKQHN